MNNNSSGGKAIRGLDVLILGFAFFATYFGAGNLIFPPQLGLNSGSDFLSGLAGLTLSGIFLPIFTLIVIGLNGDVHSITERVGKNTYNVLLAALMLVCTFVSIPRTCATAIQLGIQGNLPAAPFIPLVIAYFVISFFFVADQNIRKPGDFTKDLSKFRLPPAPERRAVVQVEAHPRAARFRAPCQLFAKQRSLRRKRRLANSSHPAVTAAPAKYSRTSACATVPSCTASIRRSTFRAST